MKLWPTPVNPPTLKELAKGKERIVSLQRPYPPSSLDVIMPYYWMRSARSTCSAYITILVATGFHRATTDAELREKYGDEIVDTVHIHLHNSMEDEMVALGLLPSGGKLFVNKVAMEADLLIGEGFIEPHFFAGFSGGRKSVLPGVVSYKTVLSNHCAEFVGSPYARTGVLENNPLHLDMLHAAKAAKLGLHH